jgi:hypothetical protein
MIGWAVRDGTVIDGTGLSATRDPCNLGIVEGHSPRLKHEGEHTHTHTSMVVVASLRNEAAVKFGIATLPNG